MEALDKVRREAWRKAYNEAKRLAKETVFIEGHQPILARKLRYFDNPWLKKMCGEGVE